VFDFGLKASFRAAHAQRDPGGGRGRHGDLYVSLSKQPTQTEAGVWFACVGVLQHALPSLSVAGQDMRAVIGGMQVRATEISCPGK